MKGEEVGMMEASKIQEALIQKLITPVTVPITSGDHLSFRRVGTRTPDEFVGHLLLFNSPIAIIFISRFSSVDNYIEVFSPFFMLPEGKLKRIIPKEKKEYFIDDIIKALTDAGYELAFLEEEE